MNFAALDNLAVNHSCWLQRCSPVAKLLFVLILLVLLLTTYSLPFLTGLALVLIILVGTNRQPLRVIAPLTLAPMVFASVIAFSLGNWNIGLVLTARAGLAALAMVLVFVSTPPVYILGLLSAPMPPVFGELLYFTYRSLFLLWGTLDNLLRAVKLRRGQGRFGLAHIRAMAQVYGMVLLRAWDLAGRQYSLLRLRGLEHGLKIKRSFGLQRTDWILLVIIIISIVGWYFA